MKEMTELKMVYDLVISRTTLLTIQDMNYLTKLNEK